jgi:hypothetical protein
LKNETRVGETLRLPASPPYPDQHVFNLPSAE